MDLKVITTRDESSNVLHRPHGRIAIIYSDEYVLNCRHCSVHAQLLCHNLPRAASCLCHLAIGS
jgi:hypothetical protein